MSESKLVYIFKIKLVINKLYVKMYTCNKKLKYFFVIMG